MINFSSIWLGINPKCKFILNYFDKQYDLIHLIVKKTLNLVNTQINTYQCFVDLRKEILHFTVEQCSLYALGQVMQSVALEGRTQVRHVRQQLISRPACDNQGLHNAYSDIFTPQAFLITPLHGARYKTGEKRLCQKVVL